VIDLQLGFIGADEKDVIAILTHSDRSPVSAIQSMPGAHLGS
jgi:hypothetical protein